MTGNELTAVSIADLQSLLRRGEVSSREVINALRERIEAVDGDDRRISFTRHRSCDERGGTRERRSSSRRRSDCDQRHHQRDGSAVHMRVENLERISRAVRRHGRSKIARRGRDSIWQNQPRRVCHGLVHGKFRGEIDAQSVGPVACAGRIQWRFGSSSGRRSSIRRARLRHWRFDSATGCAVRRRRAQADIRASFSLRPRRVCVVTRSNWARNEDRPRRCADHERYRRSRPARFHLAQRARAGLRREPRKRFARQSGWVCRRNT